MPETEEKIKENSPESKESSGDKNNKDDENGKERLANEEENFKIKSAISLASPEALVLFLIAGILDLIGLLLLLIAFDDFFILDIIGFLTIGMWLFFRTGHMSGRNTKVKNKKTGKKVLKRFGLSFLCELTPYLGGLIPAWMLLVYFELKNNPN